MLGIVEVGLFPILCVPEGLSCELFPGTFVLLGAWSAVTDLKEGSFVKPIIFNLDKILLRCWIFPVKL